MTPALVSANSTGWQSAVRMASARPGVAVTTASARGALSLGDGAVDGSDIGGMHLVHRHQRARIHCHGVGHAGAGSCARCRFGRTIRGRN